MSNPIEPYLVAPTTVPETATVGDWQPRWLATLRQCPSAFERALRGGFEADRLAWVVASGHQAALHALLPLLPPQEIAAFCVTEPGGNRPRDLRTTCRIDADGRLHIDGEKRWVTLGPVSSSCLVMCVQAEAQAGGQPALRLVRVAAGTSGLQIEAMPATAFVPELPHAEVHLRQLQIEASAMLPGDGWEAYGKPFRTLEDVYVTTAALAYLLREARAQCWPAGFVQELLAMLHALYGIAEENVAAPATQLALAGAMAQARRLFEQAGSCWAASPMAAAAVRWQRDAVVLTVASTARELRAARAWSRLFGAPPQRHLS
jgi:alkylation response protein AidB-like acyl-CoA dehydrogenase